MGVVGTLLQDTYRVTELLGTGGMGDVFAASHARLNRRFAIKILHSQFAANHEALERFRREAEITSELGHPHIVEVVDFNLMTDGAPYIVMEFLDGADLEIRMRDGRLDLKTTLHIARQISSALTAAHAKQIVHRDLKPQNVFVSLVEEDDWYVKILDFGISKIRGSTSIVTQDSTVLGTPNYMSPEQAEGKADLVDHRTDQFALATMLYEMLSGVNPFDADSIPSIMYKVVYLTPPPLDRLVPTVSPAIAQCIAQAMSKDPLDRFATVREFVRTMRGLPLDIETGPIVRVSPQQLADVPTKPAAVATVALRNAVVIPLHAAKAATVATRSTAEAAATVVTRSTAEAAATVATRSTAEAAATVVPQSKAAAANAEAVATAVPRSNTAATNAEAAATVVPRSKAAATSAKTAAATPTVAFSATATPVALVTQQPRGAPATTPVAPLASPSGTSIAGTGVFNRSARLAVVGALVVVAGVWAAVSFMRQDSSPQSNAETSQAPASNPSVPSASQPAPAPAINQPTPIRIRFVVKPTPDRLLLDGQRVRGNVATVRADGADHIVVVEKQGYTTATRTFSAFAEQTISVVLHKLRPSALRPKQRPRPKRGRTKRAPAKQGPFILDLDE